MKTSKTIAISAALLGTIGFSGLIRTVYAQSPQSAVAVMRQPHSNKLVAEASDGDGEANDATETQNHRKYAQSSTTTEASDGDGEVNDDVEEQEQAKLQPLAKITSLQAQ
ncbi:MAG: peptidase, partial [Tatlockia sp.]|nr:peptidase [Tatlockia sp.]